MKIEDMKIEVVKIEPGDILLLTVPERIPTATIELIHNRFRDAFPHHRTVIMDDRLSIKVIRGTSVDELSDMEEEFEL
jgi:hypothetical protein